MSKVPSTEADVPVDGSRRSVLRAVAGAGLMSAPTTLTHQPAMAAVANYGAHSRHGSMRYRSANAH